MRAFGVDRELGSANVISWNHQEFEVCAQWEYMSGYVCDALEARRVYHIEIRYRVIFKETAQNLCFFFVLICR